MEKQIFVKACKKKHVYYSYTEHNHTPYCEKCGEPFITNCPTCQNSIGNSIQTHILNGKPVKTPKFPDFCSQCGEKLPWKEESRNEKTISDINWSLLNNCLVDVSKQKFLDGHYADAIESGLKEFNSEVKKIYKNKTNEELDGSKLMKKAFSPNNPIIKLSNQQSESEKNIQQGYMEIFAGAITGIRNPKAHENIDISKEKAIHFLFLISLMFNKLDERI